MHGNQILINKWKIINSISVFSMQSRNLIDWNTIKFMTKDSHCCRSMQKRSIIFCPARSTQSKSGLNWSQGKFYLFNCFYWIAYWSDNKIEEYMATINWCWLLQLGFFWQSLEGHLLPVSCVICHYSLRSLWPVWIHIMDYIYSQIVDLYNLIGHFIC